MTGRESAQRSIDLFLILVLGILWGTPYALTKISLETIPPLTLVTSRVAVASALLWVVVIAYRRAVPGQWSFAGRLAIQGMLSCVIPYTMLAFGQRSVDSGLSAVLNSTAPLFVCAIHFLWTHDERLTPRKLIGVFCGLVGVVFVAGTTALAGLGQQTFGQSVIVLAAVSSAMSAVHGKKFASVAPEVVAAGTLTAATVLLLPFCLFIDTPWRLAPSYPSLSALVVNAVFATALGFVIYFRLLKTVGSIATASTSYLKPAVGALIGVCLLGESLTWPLLIALLCILAGIAAINSERPLDKDAEAAKRQVPAGT